MASRTRGRTGSRTAGVRVLAAMLLLSALPYLAEGLAGVGSPRRGAVANWLAQQQTPEGALLDNTASADVTPYFANQAAVALLGSPGGPVRVRAYLNWYLSRLNGRDRYGLSGTVYDVHPDQQGPPHYDSADAYAATYLSLARAYVERTGDWIWASRHLTDLSRVGGLLAYVQEEDGLLTALGPGTPRYLMDNAENYQGFQDWAWLLTGLRQYEAAEEARRRADMVATGIREVLWDPVGSGYRWASPRLLWPPVGSGEYSPDWTRWYPDASAQTFPFLCGVPEPEGRPADLYRRLTLAFPEWKRGGTGDAYPWFILGEVAWRLGDEAAVRDLLDYAEERFPAGEGWSRHGWHTAEAGFELRMRAAVEAPVQTAAWRLLDGSY